MATFLDFVEVLYDLNVKTLNDMQLDNLNTMLICKLSEVSVEMSKLRSQGRWHSVDECLPPYGKSVIVHLKNGSRCMTHRTEKDYSKDRNGFLHMAIADDADFWIDVPEFKKPEKM